MTASDRQLSEAELLTLQADPIATLQFLLAEAALPNSETAAILQLAQALRAEFQTATPEAIAHLTPKAD
ncbi:hypothetical protein [Synechococcus elongatus]|uniref:Uncharacterized protein n=1 Tax=Synechococcus elongatus (strain ATCC 33912 / PCC 7942 / FACHB-805) TaxID=1140 RepID=Q31NC1_SYNE7|nr:hypothetical protein [Synechococcus elongatus]ABB57448.1 hypothetical protein Synpcc7942_1418 [Synechococcus elongatus PCC 7942 = FACHB-805]AJD58895.1 hypothetical protein M744_09500 [Synechococcus elongatus UTEX 2973]MBD2588517.1 hypothetical protein [Synechococcus elongatus FACHB-242]MBD2689585.1 hypothetical protein [Synechococcus elongatus FACHB-1061]MBD2707996.1 hypothetical protein [Synechococcus elongatus PCC 7942 = FACHB-805]